MQPVCLDRYENHSAALKDSLYRVLLGKWSPCVLCLPHFTAAGAVQAECHAWTGTRMLPSCKEHRSALLSSLQSTREKFPKAFGHLSALGYLLNP